MEISLAAPDQLSPEAMPLAEEEPPLPVIETQHDYPPGVERVSWTVARPVAPKKREARAPGAPRRKRRPLPSDWKAKKRMLIACLVLLLANILVAAYLVFTSKNQRPRRPNGPVPKQPVQPPSNKPKGKPAPPPSRSVDVGVLLPDVTTYRT